MYSNSKKATKMISNLDSFVDELGDNIISLYNECAEKYEEYGYNEEKWTDEQKDTVSKLLYEQQNTVYLKKIIEKRRKNQTKDELVAELRQQIYSLVSQAQEKWANGQKELIDELFDEQKKISYCINTIEKYCGI